MFCIFTASKASLNVHNTYAWPWWRKKKCFKAEQKSETAIRTYLHATSNDSVCPSLFQFQFSVQPQNIFLIISAAHMLFVWWREWKKEFRKNPLEDWYKYFELSMLPLCRFSVSVSFLLHFYFEEIFIHIYIFSYLAPHFNPNVILFYYLTTLDTAVNILIFRPKLLCGLFQ